MTDEEFDAGVEALRAADPTHPFLLQIGAPLNTGDEVALPLPLPSLNKIKPDGSLEKWLAKFPAADYHVSVKLDGCSALWLPASKKLYTRGDGMRGRDISAFVPYFKGLVAPTTPTPIAIRGELIMRTDSPAIPQGKLARNIVAGALNRKDADPALFAEIRFVAYALENPVDQSPEAAFKTLRRLGYEVARASMLSTTAMTPTRLSELFSAAEATSPYQLDGIVVAPNVSRPATWAPEVRKGAAINPADRVAWKTRIAATTARTTVRSVEWNISAGGVIIPRVLFDSVVLAGANISAATGLHGRWIYENSVGPGATIEVRRAGDVIPQILAVHAPSPTGPAMPPAGTWAWDGPADSAVHIRPTGGSAAAEADCAILTRTLAELGAENVGPGVVAKLYAAGFRTLGQILGATAADFAARVEGFKVAAAQRTYEGLRAGAASWTELNFMVASCCFGRGVGHLKLKPLLEIQPDPARWSTAALGRPTGLSEKTVQEIVAAVPAYLAWRAANGLPKVPALPAAAAAAATTGSKMTVVLTGFRSKELEAALVAAGHTVADAVSKKTTHVAYPDGPEPTSTKLTKAKEVGATLLTASALRALLV
jgi:NAD-dependent DNA ligase